MRAYVIYDSPDQPNLATFASAKCAPCRPQVATTTKHRPDGRNGKWPVQCNINYRSSRERINIIFTDKLCNLFICQPPRLAPNKFTLLWSAIIVILSSQNCSSRPATDQERLKMYCVVIWCRSLYIKHVPEFITRFDNKALFMKLFNTNNIETMKAFKNTFFWTIQFPILKTLGLVEFEM